MKSKIRYLVYLMDNTVGVVRNLINQNFLKACWRIKNRSQFFWIWKVDESEITILYQKGKTERHIWTRWISYDLIGWKGGGGLFWWTHLIIYWLYISSVLPWMSIDLWTLSYDLEGIFSSSGDEKVHWKLGTMSHRIGFQRNCCCSDVWHVFRFHGIYKQGFDDNNGVWFPSVYYGDSDGIHYYHSGSIIMRKSHWNAQIHLTKREVFCIAGLFLWTEFSVRSKCSKSHECGHVWCSQKMCTTGDNVSFRCHLKEILPFQSNFFVCDSFDNGVCYSK